MVSISKQVNFIYFNVLFAEPKNELSTLPCISFLHYESQKKKKNLKTFYNLDNKFTIECINPDGVLINNSPAIHFFYKFEFILCN